MKRILFYGYLLSYFSAVAVPIVLDPKLSTHVRYGPRTYPFALISLLIFIVLTVAEYIVLKRAKRTTDLYWSLIPYAIAFLLTLPIFLPEIPHGNVAFVCLPIIVFSAITILLRDNMESFLIKDAILRRQDQEQRKYLREALSLSKQLAFALLAAYTAVIITWYSRILSFTKEIVTDPGEVFLLSINVGFQFAGITIYFLLGPLYCVLQTTFRILMQLKFLAQKDASVDD